MAFAETLLDSGRKALFTNFDAMLTRMNECSGTAELFQTESQIVNTLSQPVDALFSYSEATAADFRRKKTVQSAQPDFHKRYKTTLELFDTIRQIGFGLDHYFCSGTRRCCAQVGDKIADRKVHLMTYRRNNRLL